MKAPKTEMWLCAACGNTNDDRSAMPAACCQTYAMRVEKASLTRDAAGRVIECTTAMNSKAAWRDCR